MGTIKRVLRVNRKDISYLRWTIESYDGMAVVRTLDPDAAFIEVMISPGCEEMVLELLNALRDEGVRIDGLAESPSIPSGGLGGTLSPHRHI
jgi:hypothetical protein